MAFLYSLDNNVAAQNSNLRIVNFINVATLDLEHRSSQDVLLLLSVSAYGGRLHRLVRCCHKIHVFVC